MKKTQPKIKSGELMKHIGKPNDVSFFFYNGDRFNDENLKTAQPDYGDYIMLLDDGKEISLSAVVPGIPAMNVLWIKKNKIVLLPSSYLTRFEFASELKEG